MGPQAQVLPPVGTPIWRSAVLLAALGVVAFVTGTFAMAAPFSATCALLAALPDAPFSKPRSLWISHAVCIGVGVAVSWVPAPALALALVGAWLSIAGTLVLRALHAPAVAHTVILALGTQVVVKYSIVAFVVALAFALVAYVSLGRRQPGPGVAKAEILAK